MEITGEKLEEIKIATESYKKESMVRLANGRKPGRLFMDGANVSLWHNELEKVTELLIQDGWAVSLTGHSGSPYNYYGRFYPNQETLTFFEDEN